MQRKRNPADFKYSEICVAKNARGYFHPHMDWRRTVEKRTSSERFVGVAAYRKKDTNPRKNYYSEYMLPFVIQDIDRGGMKREAFNVTHRILDSMELEGVSMDNIGVLDTYGNGYHIYIPSYKFGSPVFVKRNWAKLTYRRVFNQLHEERLDYALFVPGQITRLPGSKRIGKGWACYFTVEEFRSMNMSRLTEECEHGMFIGSVPDPYEGDPDPVLMQIFLEQYAKRNEIEIPASRDIQAWTEEPTGIITRIEEGISESDEWWPSREYVGRSKAMFIYFREMLRRGNSRQQAWRLGVEVNKKHDPPMTHHELQGRMRSAIRSHNRKNGTR